MAVMGFDELNTLSAVHSRRRYDRQKIPIHDYFNNMDISEDEKEKRVRLANLLLADVLFLFALSKRNSDRKYLAEALERRYIDSVKSVAEPDQKMRRYIRRVSGSIVDATQNHPQDNYYTSIGRATSVAENEANAILNGVEYGAALKRGCTRKRWISYLDGRVRADHEDVDGAVVSIEQPFHVGGYMMMYPKDDSLGAGLEEIVNCRCSVEYLPGTERQTGEKGDSETQEESRGDGKGFLDVTGEYLNRARKRQGKVADAEKYEKDGNSYAVDGRQVLLDYSAGEKNIAELLARSFGAEVKMIPRVLSPQNVSTPDILLDGEAFDIKQPVGQGKAVLYNMIAKKKRQANNFAIDISKCPLDVEEIRRQVAGVYQSSHTRFVDKVILSKDGRILNVYQRER